MFFLLYKHTDDGVFDDFPKISDHFPKISEDFQKLFRRPDECSGTFSEDFRKLPKMSENFLRLPKFFEEDPKIFEEDPKISSHVRISYRFYQFVTTRYTSDFYIINICYLPAERSVLGKLCQSSWVRHEAAGRGPYPRPRAQFFPIRTDLGRQIACLLFSSVEYFVSSFCVEFSLQPFSNLVYARVWH